MQERGHLTSAALVVALVAASAAAARTARAASSAAIPAGGGLPALDVKVDLAAGRVDANGVAIAIPIDAAELPADGAVTVDDVPIGKGRHVAHVRVPSRDAAGGGAVWEAVLAGGREAPIFAGLTGPTAGDPGERTGKAVQIIPNGAASFVLVGDVREDLTLCGQDPTLLDPLALYPDSLELRPATVQRLGEARRAGAEKLAAVEVGPASAEAPLARLLVARGSSVAGSLGGEITDGDPRTAWREQRPGVGQGEFVVMSAPEGVPITRVRVVPAAPSGGVCAAPKTFYLVAGERVVAVTLPADTCSRPGATFEVALPRPIDAECVGVVLDSAYAPASAHPDVGIAELTAYSDLDAPGATLDDVAKRLSGDRGDAAAQVLERAGGAALGAVERAYDGLDERGRALAVDVAASQASCKDAAALLARALCEPSGQAPRRAREKLERCEGAAPALAARLRDDAPSRACVAPVLATIAPAEALVPVADALAATDEGDAATRAALRGAFAVSLRAEPAGALAPLLGDTRRSAASRLEMMRASEGRLAEALPQSLATVSELLSGAPSMRARYLVLEPLGELARAGDRAAAARLADAIARDADWPVRAHAAEIARTVAGSPELERALVAAVHDAEPRVREAALAGLSDGPPPEGVRAAIDALGHDGWSFVRLQAAGVLMNAPPSSAADDALGRALRDPTTRVRGAAALGLGRRRAVSWRAALRDRLSDQDEDAEVRAAAASALGAVCDGESAGMLARLAAVLADPTLEDDAQQIGFGALVGLAALKPPDLKDRLAPLLAPGAPPRVRSAAERALGARAMCRW